jgi:hypothetical protein
VDSQLRGKQPSDLFGDGPEQLLRRYSPCHERRDPPQRRLLLGQPTESRTSQRRSPFDLAPEAKRPQGHHDRATRTALVPTRLQGPNIGRSSSDGTCLRIDRQAYPCLITT